MLSVDSLNQMINPWAQQQGSHWHTAQTFGRWCHWLHRSWAHNMAYWKSQSAWTREFMLCFFADAVPTVSVDRSRLCAEVLETRQVCEKECQIILSVSLILVKGPNYMLGSYVSDAYLIQPYRNNPVEVLFLGHCCCILTLKIECYNSNNYIFISLCKFLQWGEEVMLLLYCVSELYIELHLSHRHDYFWIQTCD